MDEDKGFLLTNKCEIKDTSYCITEPTRSLCLINYYLGLLVSFFAVGST